MSNLDFPASIHSLGISNPSSMTPVGHWVYLSVKGSVEYIRADIVAEKDARIEFLEKALDQAIELGQLKLSEQDAGSTPGFVLCDACMDDVPIEKAPELDAYLRERDNKESA